MKNHLYLLMIVLHLGTTSLVIALPKLNSYPSASAVFFLDFDGHTVYSSVWNNGNPIECMPSMINDLQITEIFNRVAEDYRPFNLNITTDSAVFLNAPLNRRMRVIITPTSHWRPGAGGVAWLSSFSSGDDTPCFVFCSSSGSNNIKEIAEVISHETGHTLGLLHQAIYDNNCTLISAYYSGTGSGEISWAPIMGNSRNRNLSLWNFGPTQNGCNANQDNLYFITTLNGFGYRQDDHSDGINFATPVIIDVQQFNTSGIISRVLDKDVFRFDLNETGNLVLNASPFSVNTGNEGANLDLKLTLQNMAGDILRIYQPDSVLHIELDTVLGPGTYYVTVDGAGNVNTKNDYGSLGSYEIKGRFAINTNLLPIKNVTLTGYIQQNNHILNWNIDADEPIREIKVEVSGNGNDFQPLHSYMNEERRFEYSVLIPGNYYYRLSVTSETGTARYSNILKLINASGNKSNFTVHSISSGDLRITAQNKYEYQLFNYGGVKLITGSGSIGTNRVNVSTFPKGIYLLRLSGPHGTETRTIFVQ